MTTLPPEGADGQETGDQPTSSTPNEVPAPPTAPPAPPVAPPTNPPAPPVAPQPQFQAPQQPQQPQAPQQPGYQAPPQGAPQYQQAPQGGYQAPPPAGGYAQQPVADPVSNVTLNYWLSVFFNWIPALIFFLIEKDKGNAQAYAYHRDNLNFSLLRVGVVIATYIIALIPYIGWIVAVLLWIGSIVLFVFHIIAAVKAPDAYRRGEKAPFIFNIPLIK